MLAKVEFAAGIVKDETPLSAEGGWVDADKVRFRQGKPETIRGWEVAVPVPFTGIARGGHAWTSLLGDKQVAFGTANNLYAYSGGQIIDITPKHSQAVLNGPFATTSGSPIVAVNWTEHGLTPGQTVNFAFAAAVGGITVNGDYTVTDVITRNQFTITHGSNASSTATGGGWVDAYADLIAGLTDGAGGRGYGTGAYGVGVYGLPSATDFLPATWALDNLGEMLLAVRRGSPLFVWQPQAAYPSIILNGTYDADTNWAKGTGWAIGSGVATKTAGVASNLSQNIQGVARAGYIYKATFTVTRSAGTLKLRVNAGETPAVIDVGLDASLTASAPISVSGTYTRLFFMPADPLDIVFEADSAFAGTVDNVSLSIYDKAVFVPSAPRRIEHMFVAPQGTVVAVGTYEVDGDYNPNAVRNSDVGNYREWVPDTDNLASEIILRGGGGRLVRGMATRQQNLIWGDDGLFRLQWQGEVGQAFSSDLIGTGCGLIGVNAAAEHNGIAFWLSANGNFYIFQGAIPQVIDCRIRRDVFENIAPAQEEKIFCGINAEFSEAWWFYPDGRDGTECSRYAAFNWIENHWTCGTFGRSTWIRGGIFGYPIAFGTDGYIYFHERGNTANGGVFSAHLESSAFDIEDGQNLITIKGIIPDIEEQQGSLAFSLKTRYWPNGSEYDAGTYVAAVNTRYLHMRRNGRQVAVRLATDAGPNFWRLGALRFDVVKSGATR